MSRAPHLHHDGRVTVSADSLGLWTRSLGTLVARAKAGFGSVKKRQVGGAVAAFVLRFVLFFDVVGDVPVVQVVDVVLSSSWTRLSSCPLLCKTGVMVQTVQPVVFRCCSSWTRW